MYSIDNVISYAICAMNREYNEEIISLIQARLDKGRTRYGHGLLVKDSRDWIIEALEELLDGMIYLTTEIIRYKNTLTQSKDKK